MRNNPVPALMAVLFCCFALVSDGLVSNVFLSMACGAMGVGILFKLLAKKPQPPPIRYPGYGVNIHTDGTIRGTWRGQLTVGKPFPAGYIQISEEESYAISAIGMTPPRLVSDFLPWWRPEMLDDIECAHNYRKKALVDCVLCEECKECGSIRSYPGPWHQPGECPLEEEEAHA